MGDPLDLVEWAILAFAELARECEEIARLDVTGPAERRTWLAMANKSRRNVTVLKQRTRKRAHHGKS
mgnify:FL=1